MLKLQGIVLMNVSHINVPVASFYNVLEAAIVLVNSTNKYNYSL